MMKRVLFIIMLLIISKNHTCYAQSVSSTELINNAKSYDGHTVAYKGEVIGDIMVRQDFAWINLNDDRNAIGVWIKKEQVKDIIYTGSYKVKGDVVEITGIFHRSCVEHGGDLDIHALAFTKISSGGEVSHPVSKKEINLILVFSGLIAAACLLRSITVKFRNASISKNT